MTNKIQIEYGSLEEKVQELETLLDVSLQLNATLDLDEAIHLVLDVAMAAIGAEAGTLWLLTEDGEFLEPLAARGPKADSLKGLKLNQGEGLAGQVTASGEPVLVEDVSKDSRWASRFDASTGFVTRSMLVVPLRGRQSSIGCLQVINKQNNQLFSPADLRLCMTLCHQSALLIENSRMYTYEHRFLNSMINTIMATADERNPFTRGHSERVSRYCRQLAQALELRTSECTLMELAGKVHDIGKIVLPESVIKASQFDGKNREQLKKHPALGAQLLFQMEPKAMVRQLWAGTLYHHEQFDGNGYPAGLSGDAIPLVARIVAVANTFDILVSEREYDPALSYEEAQLELEHRGGKELDPRLVATFITMLRNDDK